MTRVYVYRGIRVRQGGCGGKDSQLMRLSKVLLVLLLGHQAVDLGGLGELELDKPA